MLLWSRILFLCFYWSLALSYEVNSSLGFTVYQWIQENANSSSVLRIPAQAVQDNRVNHVNKLEVVILTHLTPPRFPRLVKLLKSWNGPSVVGIFFSSLNRAQTIQMVDTIIAVNSWNDKVSWVLYDCTKYNTGYPINSLRNLSLVYAKSLYQNYTAYAVMMDVDFSFQTLPSHHNSDTSAYKTMESLVSKAPDLLTSKKGYIIPVYSSSYEATDRNAGHGPYHSVMSNKEETEIIYAPQFEPYLLLPLNSHPHFPEQFTIQGGDKQAFIGLLNAMGYSFFLPSKHERVFAIHWVESVNDSDTAGEDKWWGGQDQMYSYFQDWPNDMKRRFGWRWKWPRGVGAGKLANEGSWGRDVMHF